MTVYEQALVERVLELITDGVGITPYRAYNNLRKELRQKYSLYDIVVLFHKLEWNVKVIEADELYEVETLDPWEKRGSPSSVMKKKSVAYRLREKFRHIFATQERHQFLDKIVRNLDNDNLLEI